MLRCCGSRLTPRSFHATSRHHRRHPRPRGRPVPRRAGASAPRTFPSCNLPESDAEALYILNAIYPNRYIWDDAGITVSVQAAPNVDQAYVDAAQDAIAAWAEVIEDCFDGLITLTDVTDDPTNPQSADIVLHYVPYAGAPSSPATPSAAPTAARTSWSVRNSRPG